jgi:hypothetical protein
MSKHIKLQAAFNHLHIFIDPDPNPAKSFAERERLFKLPRSNWTDYDAKLISKGGGVFERSAKTIKLSAEMKALLEINKAEATPTEILNAILRANVDLMFFGGIGTYVKAGTESNADFKYHDSNAQPQGFGHICFSVPDLDAAVKWFDDNQVVYVKRPEQGKMKDVAFIKDPDGYWIEIVEPGRLKKLGV